MTAAWTNRFARGESTPSCTKRRTLAAYWLFHSGSTGSGTSAGQPGSEAVSVNPALPSSHNTSTSALLAFVAIGAALPVLPAYVRGPLHAGDVAVGVVVGAFAITSVVCRPLAGRRADAHGRRVVLVAGSLSMAVGGVLYLLAASVPELIVARLAVGAGEGAVAGGLVGVLLGPPGVAVGLVVGGLVGSSAGAASDLEAEPQALADQLRAAVPRSSSAVVLVAASPDVDEMLSALGDSAQRVTRQTLTADQAAALETSLSAAPPVSPQL